MWVLTAESPLGLGPLYVPQPFQCKEKVDFFVKPVEILPVPLWEEFCLVLKSFKCLTTRRERARKGWLGRDKCSFVRPKCSSGTRLIIA
jgi:hypothetical protein